MKNRQLKITNNEYRIKTALKILSFSLKSFFIFFYLSFRFALLDNSFVGDGFLDMRAFLDYPFFLSAIAFIAAYVYILSKNKNEKYYLYGTKLNIYKMTKDILGKPLGLKNTLCAIAIIEITIQMYFWSMDKY